MTTETPVKVWTPQGHGLGCQPDLPDQRDFKYTPQALYADPRALPDHVDLRTSGLVRPVQNQGSLGSCTSFSACNAFYYVMRKMGQSGYDPSELFHYYNERLAMGTVNSDSGASIRQSMSSLAKEGQGLETDWPYNISQFTVRPPTNAYTNGLSHQLVSYLAVQQTLDSIKACLAEGFPVCFGFGVYDSFERAPASTTGYVQMPQVGERLLGGHANYLVGYLESGRYFISVNSWGTGFGAAGMMYFPYDFIVSPKYCFDFWTPRVAEGPTPTPPPPSPTPTPTPVVSPVTKVTTVLTYKDGHTKQLSITA